jgi:RNA polymerase sigma-70 factor (ECF subfamily)
LGDFFRANGRQVNAHGGAEARARLEELTTSEGNQGEGAEGLSAEVRLLHSRVLELIRNEFEEKTWRACLRVVADGRKPRDVADELGMSVNSVYLAKSRVLRRVRDELAGVLQ